MKKVLLKNDLTLILVLLLIPMIALAVFYVTQKPANEDAFVVITVKGQLYDRLPLSNDTEIVIETNLGTNHIIISDGRVWISQATCPDQLCVNHKAVSLTGGQIVCLPNQVVVSVEAAKDSIDSLSE